MSLFQDSPLPLANRPATVRLLPLPNLVCFPHVMQPLHVSESRYRDLLEDALAGDQLIVVATLARGWERDYEGRPPLLPMACLSRIVAHHRLEDGCYNVLLKGLRRVRLLRELPPKRSFREAQVEVLEDVYAQAPAAAISDLTRRIRHTLITALSSLPQTEDQVAQLLDSGVSLGALTDIISYVLDIGLEERQALLSEVNVQRRVELVLGHLSVAAADTAPGRAGATAFPPEFGLN